MLPSELLESYWVNHAPYTFHSGKGQEHCLITAFATITNGIWSMEHQEILVGIIGEDQIIKWNDAPGRTKREVVAVARLAEIKMGLRVEGEDWAEEEPLEIGAIEMELVGV